MGPGTHVELIDGVLRGERARIALNPEIGEWFEYGGAGTFWVWIRFDNDGAVYGREKGFAILSQQWYEADRLRLI